MLGDATMKANHNSGKAIIAFQQTFPAHMYYLFFIYYFLSSLVRTGPRLQVRKPDVRTGKIYMTLGFGTRYFSFLYDYYNMFYIIDTNGKRRKIVPANLAHSSCSCFLDYG